jgi:hypothetical protein
MRKYSFTDIEIAVVKDGYFSAIRKFNDRSQKRSQRVTQSCNWKKNGKRHRNARDRIAPKWQATESCNPGRTAASRLRKRYLGTRITI